MSDVRKVPGEDVGRAAPVALLFLGLLGAASASALFAQSASAEESSKESSASAVSVVAPMPPPPLISNSSPSPPPASTPSSVEPACAPARVAFFSSWAAPTAAARAEVDKIALWMVANPEVTALIDGHADAAGTEDGNLRLSHMRAEAIARELVARGVARARLTVRGYGSFQPLEGVREDAADNRRVVVHFRGACPRGFEEVIGP